MIIPCRSSSALLDRYVAENHTIGPDDIGNLKVALVDSSCRLLIVAQRKLSFKLILPQRGIAISPKQW